MAAGRHVPLIVSWPNQIKESSVFEELIGFGDFFPPLTELAGTEAKEKDGKSFYPLLVGAEYEPRETTFVHYDP